MEKTQQSEAGQVAIRRTYPVAPEKVWRAWTEPQALSQWFGPSKEPSLVTAEIDLRTGGAFRIAFKMPSGEVQEASGIYQEVMPYERLVFSWAWKGTPDRVSRISMDMKAVAEGCELLFVHDRFFDETARANHEKGWTMFFENLDRFVQTASSSKTKEA